MGIGDTAPAVPGVGFGDGPVGLFFYKVTCPTCQMAAPKVGRFERAYPGRVVGIGQDPPEELERFAREFAMPIRTVADLPPYEVSDAYGIVSVPTLVLVGNEGRIEEWVGAWDRDGFNRVSRRIARAMGAEPVLISHPRDGLPSLRPG
jgi:thiol-disulfide isomerase/thioredoxin